MMDNLQLTHILGSLLDSNNENRAKTEIIFNELKSTSPSQLILSLVPYFNCENESIRSLVCILIRGMTIREHQLFQNIDDQNFLLLRNKIIESILLERNLHLKKKMINCRKSILFYINHLCYYMIKILQYNLFSCWTFNHSTLA